MSDTTGLTLGAIIGVNVGNIASIILALMAVVIFLTGDNR